jgi:hypothetical protein
VAWGDIATAASGTAIRHNMQKFQGLALYFVASGVIEAPVLDLIG